MGEQTEVMKKVKSITFSILSSSHFLVLAVPVAVAAVEVVAVPVVAILVVADPVVALKLNIPDKSFSILQVFVQ